MFERLTYSERWAQQQQQDERSHSFNHSRQSIMA